MCLFPRVCYRDGDVPDEFQEDLLEPAGYISELSLAPESPLSRCVPCLGGTVLNVGRTQWGLCGMPYASVQSSSDLSTLLKYDWHAYILLHIHCI